jgi:hypothetical protein
LKQEARGWIKRLFELEQEGFWDDRVPEELGADPVDLNQIELRFSGYCSDEMSQPAFECPADL